MSESDFNEDRIECLQITNDGRNAFLLRTGELINSDSQLIGGILPKSYQPTFFPGDFADNYAKWVVDTAIEMNNRFPLDYFF